MLNFPDGKLPSKSMREAKDSVEIKHIDAINRNRLAQNLTVEN